MEYEAWNNPDIARLLTEVLEVLTGDRWHIEFARYKKPSSVSCRQTRLFCDNDYRSVMAFSEGLDSLCASGLAEQQGKLVRVRVVHHSKKDNFRGQFDQLPYTVTPRQGGDQSSRSRGFKFTAIASVVAAISDAKSIVTTESGQGVLGSALLDSYGVYPDFRSHPVFLRKMERFINLLLGNNIKFVIPRIWHTKAETIRDFTRIVKENKQLVLETRSCWQSRHNVRFDGKLRQCGVCSACLLRRMSLLAAEIEEKTDTYTVADLTVNTFSKALPKNGKLSTTKTLPLYGRLATRQMQRLADLSARPNSETYDHAMEIAEAISRPSEQVSVDLIHSNLRDLLKNHAIARIIHQTW